MDSIADDIRERIKLAVPFVSDAVKGDSPFAYEPPRVEDQVDEFLRLDGNARHEMFAQMGPDQFRDYTTDMMHKVTDRYGAAAKVLMPLFNQYEAQDAIGTAGIDVNDGLTGFAQARAELRDLLGVDILGDS